MKKRMVVLCLFLVLALLLCAFTPGGRARIPVPGEYVSTAGAVMTGAGLADATATAPARMPGRGGATPPAICGMPGGPRC